MARNKITDGRQDKSLSKPLNDSPVVPHSEPGALEQTKLEMNVRLEEYKALRAEIVATLSSSHLTTNLTLTAGGILIAGSPFIIQYHAIHLFLLAAYGFYLIAWTQLHYVHVVYNISEHIGGVIAPKVRDGITKLGPVGAGRFADILTWEEAGRASGLWAIPLQAARYLFPVCAALASAVGFLVNVTQLTSPWWQKYSVWLGGVSNLVLLLYTLFLTFKISSLTRKYVRK